MTGVRVRPRLTNRIDAARRGHVGILTGHRRARGLVLPRLAGIQLAVAVRVATHKQRREIVRQIARRAAVVSQRDVGQRHVARIGHHIRPRDRAAHRHQRPGRRVRILTVGRLLDVDLGADAKVVTGVRVRPRLPKRIDAARRSHVAVLANDGRAGGLVHPRLAGIQQTVVIGVAAYERGIEIIGQIGRCAVVIADHDTGQRYIAGIGHHVGPGDRAAGRHQRPGGRVRILTVGRLLDADFGADAEIMTGVGVVRRLAERIGAVDRGHVRILTSNGDTRGLI